MKIEELNGANCKTYLISSGESAALVDPVRERVELYRRTLAERDLRIEMILETHTHADHLMIGRDAKAALGARLVMHRDSPSPLVDRHVDDGDVLILGRERITVLHTPGHTPDSVSYLLPGAVLTGDVLWPTEAVPWGGLFHRPGGNIAASLLRAMPVHAPASEILDWI